MRCLICKKLAEHHHVKTRGSGGADDEWNLMPLCRVCHTAIHKIGLTSFSKKHSTVEKWLTAHGWQFNEFLNKWRR